MESILAQGTLCHSLANPPSSISDIFTFTSCDLALPSAVYEEHQPCCSSAHQSGSPAAMKWAICGMGRAQRENNGFMYSWDPDFLSRHSHCLNLDSSSLKKGSVSHKIKGWLWQGDYKCRGCVLVYLEEEMLWFRQQGKVEMTKHLRQDRGVVPPVTSILHNN